MMRDRNQILPFHTEKPQKKPSSSRISLKDCLTLLIGTAIPVAIGIYTNVTSEEIKKTAQSAEDKQQSIANERREFDMKRAHEIYQQNLYEKFLETMYTFHKDGELNDSADPWAFANARYRALHREFDAIRKGQTLLFLKEKELIGRQKCTTGCESKSVKDIIRLKGLSFDNLNLSSENDGLSQLDLSCVEFDEISIRNAVFSNTNLNGAVFKNSRLNGATFQDSSLNCAQIEKSKLNGTNFSDSSLNGTVFKDVDLSTTKLTNEQKHRAHFENVIMPDKTKFTSTTQRVSITPTKTTTYKSTTEKAETVTTTITTKSTKEKAETVIATTTITEKSITKSTREWLFVNSMNYTRRGHTASILTDGKVLVAGGSTISGTGITPELYDPSKNSWLTTGNLNEARYYHTSSILSTGKVLLVGGYLTTTSSNHVGGSSGLATAELYNPLSNSWTRTGYLAFGRYGHTAVVLSDGKVLATSGRISNQGGIPHAVTESAEVYDPSASGWVTVARSMSARFQPTASLLLSGKVLVVGGIDYMGVYYNSTELYNPSNNSWIAAGKLNNARSQHTASVLSDGKVLVVGGSSKNGPITSAEIYDPSTNKWNNTGSLYDARYQHTATVLKDGKVLVTGGMDNNRRALQSVEIYDPSTNQWTIADNLNNARAEHTASLLSDGRVLVAGGINGSTVLNTAEVY